MNKDLKLLLRFAGVILLLVGIGCITEYYYVDINCSSQEAEGLSCSEQPDSNVPLIGVVAAVGGLILLALAGLSGTNRQARNARQSLDSNPPATQFGNAATAVPVKVVSAGMTIAEIEAVLGPPVTRVDLGEKVVYRYSGMTVEFHGGKVTDVR